MTSLRVLPWHLSRDTMGNHKSHLSGQLSSRLWPKLITSWMHVHSTANVPCAWHQDVRCVSNEVVCLCTVIWLFVVYLIFIVCTSHSSASICSGSTEPNWHNLNMNTITTECKFSHKHHSIRRFKSSPENLTELSGCIVSNDWMIMNDELGSMLKEQSWHNLRYCSMHCCCYTMIMRRNICCLVTDW
jgi:hypothetical protein